MPEDINVDEQSGIVNIRSYGVVSKNDLVEVIEKVKEINKKKHISRVLVDTREEERLIDTLDMYDIFTHFPSELRVALLAEESQKTFKDVSFVETIAQNRGFKIKKFLSKDAGMEWLGKS